MRRSLGALVLAVALLGACSGQPAAQSPSLAAAVVTPTPVATPTPTPVATPTPTAEPTPEITPEPTPEITPEPTPEITPKPTPKPTPVSYVTLTSRAWALLVKAPDTYLGKAYKVWGCISQFDAATGADSFRAQASYRNETYWYSDGVNAFFTGDEAKLADFVAKDVVAMSVLSLGSYSYDTQNGGNTTVPMFQIVTIKRISGSC